MYFSDRWDCVPGRDCAVASSANKNIFILNAVQIACCLIFAEHPVELVASLQG